MNKKTLKPHDLINLCDRPGYLIRRLHQIHVALFLEECREFNLTPVQFAVLTVLVGGETLDQVTIANLIGADRNTVADVIRRLERRGLLDRPPSVSDKRVKLARITAQGRKFVDGVQPAIVKVQNRFVDPLTDKEYDTLTQLLRKIDAGNQ